MDFYRINEEYNKFLQRYEKEKRGVTKVPNIRYTDRNKFAFGAVMQVNGMNVLKNWWSKMLRMRNIDYC